MSFPFCIFFFFFFLFFHFSLSLRCFIINCATNLSLSFPLFSCEDELWNRLLCKSEKREKKKLVLNVRRWIFMLRKINFSSTLNYVLLLISRRWNDFILFYFAQGFEGTNCCILIIFLIHFDCDSHFIQKCLNRIFEYFNKTYANRKIINLI